LTFLGHFCPCEGYVGVDSAPAKAFGAVRVLSELERKKAERAELERRRVEREHEQRWARAAVTVLRAARDDADLTQKEMAARLGWSHRQVVNLEHLRRAVRIVDVAKYARALEIDPLDLLTQIAQWVQHKRPKGR